MIRVTTIFIDGASRGNPGPSAIAVFNPKTGNFLAKKIGMATNNFAEYMALQTALLKYFNVKDLIIKTDSQLIFNQLKGTFKVRSTNIVPMYTTCQGLILGRKEKKCDTTIEWIKREENYADEIVNWILDKYEGDEAKGDWNTIKGQAYIIPD